MIQPSTSGCISKGNAITIWEISANHFAAVLLRISKAWKHRKCPTTDERIKNCGM